ncbi:hypothetical protein GCM10009733_020340 [Nonomuraea maheshkhaliensis]|uniref:DUF6927 domain-containing protein n=2 Tax=Nonomuraea maheshkhaliensis TaxID=419590 RepID=A0ABN2EZF3_9ACTN
MEGELPNTLTAQGCILACATVRGVFYAAVQERRSSKVWALVVLIKRGRGYYNCTYKEMEERDGPVEDHCPVRILELLSPLPACSHDEEYCRLCNAEIALEGGQWNSRALPGQRPDVAGPRCIRGYPIGAAAPDGSAPLHEPGGTASCSTCWARNWRERCRANDERERQARRRAKAVRPGTRVRFGRPLQFSNGEQRDTFIFVTRSTFRAPDSNDRYSIPRWRIDHEFKIISPPLA